MVRGGGVRRLCATRSPPAGVSWACRGLSPPAHAVVSRSIPSVPRRGGRPPSQYAVLVPRPPSPAPPMDPLRGASPVVARSGATELGSLRRRPPSALRTPEQWVTVDSQRSAPGWARPVGNGRVEKQSPVRCRAAGGFQVADVVGEGGASEWRDFAPKKNRFAPKKNPAGAPRCAIPRPGRFARFTGRGGANSCRAGVQRAAPGKVRRSPVQMGWPRVHAVPEFNAPRPVKRGVHRC